MNVILKALDDDASFDSAVDCMCTIYRDTREVDDCLPTIQNLYPRLVALRPKLREAAEAEDVETFKGLTRLFAEAGEAWVVLVARLPSDFRGLVETVLECCARDQEREAISYTFNFWYELKQYITLERYAEARAKFADVYSQLVDVMIKHLEFPTPEGNETDLFDGDREQEDRFRSFRHSMGDVLKDCCAVIGVTECLMKAYRLVQQWVSKYAAQASNEHVPHWQELEAPLFSMRAMGRMVDSEESTVLPQVIPLIVQIPDQERVRFSAIMALGRYTEWTAQHPETLEAQLNYVISGFQHRSQEVVGAAALAFKYLGTDCAKLLGGHIPQLHSFYESVIDKLKPQSQEEVTEGVAAVVAVQPVDKIYESMKLFCDPLMARIMNLANNAKDEQGQRAVAGRPRGVSSGLFDKLTFSRSPAIDHHLCSSRLTIRGTGSGEPRGQILWGNTSYHEHPRHELYEVYTDPGACVPVLAVHGDLISNGHDSLVTQPGTDLGSWLRSLQRRLLLVGHGRRRPRIF